MTDHLVIRLISLPPRQRRDAAREAGVSFAAVVLRAKAMLADPAALAEWPAELRRFGDSLTRQRTARSASALVNR